ncbi:glycosyltransferase family 2 protein (plasmid) [Aliisedimentitalea scapharcae]|uniref:Glycosyltransferase family 2 protein n=1 Tax=Aliisedimentitalea scapharcae TaxID=1524259 RepID=A0ABZ2XZ56_9RHOB
MTLDLSAIFDTVWGILGAIVSDPVMLYILVPLIILVEAPLTLVVLAGMLKWRWRYDRRPPLASHPDVSCIITCYGEGDAIIKTILTLCEQTYPGNIEIIAVIDGAVQNGDTYQAALDCEDVVQRYPKRKLVVLPKWQRGGRVSTLNAGLYAATGDIVMNADGDTSFDNNMMVEIIREFDDPNVPAVGGALRVRNDRVSLVTRMQAFEYMISIQGGKTGLGEWNLLNNISGAFGAFRREFLKQIGGWDTHTAEDLDLTVRIKQYFGRHPNMRIPFAGRAIGHTDAPETFKQLLNQRLRWDGDLVFLYLRKHRNAFSPRLLGIKTLVFTFVYGVLQNVLFPVLIVAFNIWILAIYPLEFVVAIFALQYSMYLVFAALLFGVFWVGVSERMTKDSIAWTWLPAYPLYTFILRVFAAFATLNEVLRRGHEESNMAPWWVLKRGRRF